MLQDELYQYIRTLDVIDTHEHLPIRNDARNPQGDIFTEYCLIYFNRDLICAGMPHEEAARLLDPSLPVMDRWEMAAPYWEHCRHTGYGQALDLGVQELYGIPRIDSDTIQEVNRKIQESLQTNHYTRVLKEVCRVRTALLDADDSLSADRKFFSPVVRVDPFVYLRRYGDLLRLERAYGKSITSLDAMKDACRKALYEAVEQGAAAFKCGLAYQRGLSYPRATACEAERAFLDAFEGCDLEREDRPFAPSPAYQSYMLHYALSVIEELDTAIQFHTGLLEGNGNHLEQSDPQLLIPLFLQYPRVRFDIFHIGYPYQHVLGGLAKMFPNVYIDMCWAHIVSPVACVRSLEEWLETVPDNKICAFGGDHCFIDGVAGHRRLASRNVAKALAHKVEEGLFDAQRARRLARRLFFDNPVQLFQLTGI